MGMNSFAAIAAASIVGIAATASAQAPDSIAAADLEWREMFPGVHFAPAHGDWEKAGHGKFVRFAPGTQVPMHTHSNFYRGVMISGQMENIFEEGRVPVGQGDYWFVADKRPHGHQCLSKEPCFFYTYGDSLWDIQLTE
ncbi:MAG TPA: cupin domain-containing protein [Sphingomicrobium sp.]|nr:cupin domain-containing protein [Sphingomicrobium sp.]